MTATDRNGLWRRLAELHAGAFIEGPRAWSADELEAVARGPGVRLLTEGDAGFLLVRVVLDEAEILTLAVDSALRRRGVGRALLARGEAAARAAGAARMTLEVGVQNAAALALYRKAGYLELARRPGYYGPTPTGDALILSKLLSCGHAISDPRLQHDARLSIPSRD